MGRHSLSNTEIHHRLQRLRNLTRLYAVARQKLQAALATVRELQALLAAKDARIAELEARLANTELERKTLASYLYRAGKDKGLERGEAKPQGKRPGAPAYHRPTPAPETVTERVTFSLSRCPICSGTVGEAVDQAEKYSEDIDPAPRLIVKHYTITRHWCPHCETFVKAANVPPMPRIGLNVLAYVLYARYRLRLPVNKIKESLYDLHNFQLSEGEVIAQLDRAHELFGKDYAAITELVKDARVVYGDETGWRMDGENWWLWVFVTEQEVRYTLENTRGSGVAKQALGPKQDRVIVSDGYAAYGSLPGDNQQCWVHLLRAAKQASPTVYAQLCQLYEQLGLELAKPCHEREPTRFEAALDQLANQPAPELTAPKLQQRIRKHRDKLLVCLHHDGVLPENNTAERAIRPQVVMRKVFGGSRSPKGADTHAVNSSVIATQLKRQPDVPFFEVMLPLLRERSGV